MNKGIRSPSIGVEINRCAAGGLPEERYSVRIAAEGADIFVDPLDG
jgi:hypothetical protein